MPNTFYIARHGQSEGNAAGDVMGGDFALTEVGRQQARDLTELLTHVQFDQVFASNLIRAQETAQFLADSKNLKVRIDERLSERSFGTLEGQTAAYFSQNFSAEIEAFRGSSLEEQMHWKIVEGMESLNQVLQRVLPFFETLPISNKDQSFLVVTHANVILALLSHFGFISSFRELPYGSIKNTSYLKVQKDNDTFKLLHVEGITKKI